MAEYHSNNEFTALMALVKQTRDDLQQDIHAMRTEDQRSRIKLNDTLQTIGSKLAEHEKYWGVVWVIGKIGAWFTAIVVASIAAFKGLVNGGP